MKKNSNIVLASLTLTLTTFAGLAHAQPLLVYASGIGHEPIGSAQLGPATDRRLPVHNLGSSGEDGVEIQLGSLFGGGVAIDATQFQNAAGSEIKIKHKGWDGLIYGNHRSRSNGNGTGLDTFDFSALGVTELQVTDYDANGIPVSTQSYIGPIADVPWVGQVIQCPSPCFWERRYWWAIVNGKPHLVSRGYCVCPGPGGGGGDNPTGLQNARVITPSFPVGVEPAGVQSMIVTSSGLPEFTITATDLGTFGQPSHGVGQAQIAESCDDPLACGAEDRKLTVSNIGSSGQDGVAIDLPRNGGVQWRRRDTCCPSPGHTTLTRIMGGDGLEISSIAESPSPLPDERVVTSDFSAIGASGVSVRCFDDNGGVIVERVFPGTGVAVRGPRCPVGSYWGFNSNSHSWGCIIIFHIVLPSGETVGGVSRVECTALGATSASRPSSMEITASGLTEFSIDNLFVQPPPCVADVDDGSGTGTPDGGVTIEDLLHYLAIFDQGVLAADVDDGSGTGTPDGGVTIEDLLYYLQRFDSGC